MNHRIAAYLICGFFSVLLLCASIGAEQKRDTKTVLCTFWPEYVFALNVANGIEGIRLEMMIPAAGSPHSFTPTPGDLQKVSEADLIIANGYLEEFLPKLRQTFRDKPIICTADAVKLIENEHSAEHEGEEDEANEEHEGHNHGRYNPHTWLSLMNAIVEVDAIRAALTELVPGKANQILQNATNYQMRLFNLRAEALSASLKFKQRNIVTFHNGFDYLAAELGLKVVAVIMEVAGQSPSPAQVQELIDLIKKSGGAAVFAEPQFPQKIAELISANLGIQTFVLDPGVSTEPVADAYEKVMRSNIATLSKALNAE